MVVLDYIQVLYIPSKKSSAQEGICVNSVLTRNGYIKCYISLFQEIILQQCDAFQTEIQVFLTKPCAFKASRGHASKMVKLGITVFKFVIWGGISSNIRSEILFYGDASELLYPSFNF